MGPFVYLNKHEEMKGSFVPQTFSMDSGTRGIMLCQYQKDWYPFPLALIFQLNDFYSLPTIQVYI